MWNQGDPCQGTCTGPWVVLVDTDVRRCLRCLYAESFMAGMKAGHRQAVELLQGSLSDVEPKAGGRTCETR